MSQAEKVRQAIANSLSRPIEDVCLASRLRELCDSMELAQLVLDLEIDFSTEISDDELQKLFTVQDVADYIDQAAS